MVFSNSVFLLLFLPIAIAVYYLLMICRADIRIRNTWLLLISLGFYAWGEPYCVFLMMLSILLNHLFGIWVEKYAKQPKGKRIVAYACVYNLGQLFFFKYLGWVLGLFIGAGIKDTFIGRIALPIGISFYTFQALSYVIDVYRGKDKAQHSILNTGLYIAFFPQLIAGPIVRYHSIAEQLQQREHSIDKFSEGVWRFCIGLSKKAILANHLSILSDIAFSRAPSQLSALLAWVGALCFMLQIYYDFSGYSDMAIGLGKMFGFEFQENFNYPYISLSVTEYWRRWHISLGEWFRDYLYYPLTFGPAVRLRKRLGKKVSRKTASKIAAAAVLFCVWLATGIWHGANVTFIVWGLIQFLFIFWEQNRKPIKNHSLSIAVGFTTTFLVVLLTKVIFKSTSMTQAFHYYGSMLCLEGNPLFDAFALYWIREFRFFIAAGILFIFPVVPWLRNRVDGQNRQWVKHLYHTAAFAAMAVMLAMDILYAVIGEYNPFLYFNF